MEYMSSLTQLSAGRYKRSFTGTIPYRASVGIFDPHTQILMGQATKLDKQSNAPRTTQIAGCLGLRPNALQYLNKTRGFSQALVIKAQTIRSSSIPWYSPLLCLFIPVLFAVAGLEHVTLTQISLSTRNRTEP